MLTAIKKIIFGHPQEPHLISYATLSAFKDEPRFRITAAEYNDIKEAIARYMRSGGSMVSAKISRNTDDIKYSVNVVDGNFILSYHIHRINELESYIYRAKNDHRPLAVEDSKTPLLYDAAINLNTGKPLFIKEYRDTGLNAKAEPAEREKQINELKAEYNNITELKKPCLFWTRNNKYYLATPYVDKYDFYEWMNKDKGSAEEAVEIFRSIVNQVLDMHAKGWIHCDIKAENFVPTKAGGKLQAVFVDMATFHRTSKAAEISTIISSRNIVNPSWKSDFEKNKASFGTQTDIYALNTLLVDVAEFVDIKTKSPTSKRIFELISTVSAKPIADCYTATQLLGFAEELRVSLQTNPSNKNKL